MASSTGKWTTTFSPGCNYEDIFAAWSIDTRWSVVCPTTVVYV
jgi:hypothetical protein